MTKQAPRPAEFCWTLATMIEMFPSIDWTEPLPVRYLPRPRAAFLITGGTLYACRICIAQLGLNAAAEYQWKTPAECAAHIRREHPKG